MPFAPECFSAFQTRATFWKISIGPPFALFKKIRVLGDLAKIVVTSPFGHFCSRCLRLNLLQFSHFKSILIRGYCNLRQSTLSILKRGLLFLLFFKNLPWSPLCTFSENGTFGWPCQNCHKLAIRALLDPLCARKSFAVFALQVHTN